MLAIRLTRIGKKNSPAYRVVVAEKRRAVKRKFIEILGNYNPSLQPKQIKIDNDRAVFWMSQGAQPSDTVRNLMADLGILKKSEKATKIYAKKKEVVAEEKKEAASAEVKVEEPVEAETPAEAPVESAEEAAPVEEEVASDEPLEAVENTETTEEAK